MNKVAVIGVGNIGYHHARIYSSLENVELVGIADISEKIGKSVAKRLHTKYYKNFEEMLKKEDIDAVSIAVPTFLHKEVALITMKYVKKILIEKPIADTVKNAKKIIKAAEKNNTHLNIGYIERHNPVINELYKLIKSESIGKPISVVIKRVGLFPSNVKDADVITDLATHDIYILNYIFRTEPNLIAATGGKIHHSKFDHAEIILEYKGINCFIQTNWITPVKIRTIAITGDKGYIEADYITQEILMHKTQLKRSFLNFNDFIVKFGKPKTKIIKVVKEEPLKIELESFLNTPRSSANATGRDGLYALELAEKAIKYITK